MNHRQKARRLERRRTHQSIPRGRGVPYPSRHRTDPPKHGAELKALAQEISARAIRAWEMMESDARIYGFTVTEGGRRVDPRTIFPPGAPTRELHDKFDRLKREVTFNTNVSSGSPQSGPRPPIVHADEIELLLGDDHPSEREWEEITATAKHRKRSIKEIAKKHGFKLVGDDPKARESWVR